MCTCPIVVVVVTGFTFVVFDVLILPDQWLPSSLGKLVSQHSLQFASVAVVAIVFVSVVVVAIVFVFMVAIVLLLSLSLWCLLLFCCCLLYRKEAGGGLYNLHLVS